MAAAWKEGRRLQIFIREDEMCEGIWKEERKGGTRDEGSHKSDVCIPIRVLNPPLT